MNYRTYTPNPLLSKYVKYYWSLENENKSLPILKEKVFPDGCIELIFHFGDLFIKHLNNSSDFQPRCFIHGQIKEFMEIEPSGKTGIFSVRFHPNGLKPFTSFHINEITGKNIAIENFWGKEGNILEDKILNAKSNEHRVMLVENFLLKKLTNHQDDKIIDHCVHSIIQTNGNINIQLLAKNVNMGRRHLERKFISNVGVSPKMLSRIIRFQNILNLIENNLPSNLTMIAYEGGFYDQAHFIKDFKEFTGLNPKQYSSENLPLVKYFSFE